MMQFSRLMSVLIMPKFISYFFLFFLLLLLLLLLLGSSSISFLLSQQHTKKHFWYFSIIAALVCSLHNTNAAHNIHIIIHYSVNKRRNKKNNKMRTLKSMFSMRTYLYFKFVVGCRIYIRIPFDLHSARLWLLIDEKILTTITSTNNKSNKNKKLKSNKQSKYKGRKYKIK